MAENLDRTGTVNYAFIVNNLSAEVANLPDYVPNRQASGVGTHSGGDAPASGVVGKDGKVFTGFYRNFNTLSQDDKDTIFEERKRLGISPKKSRRASAVKKGGSLKDKHKQVITLQRKIASLKKKVAFKTKSSESKVSDSDDDSIQNNAGDSFGGREAKKAKKE